MLWLALWRRSITLRALPVLSVLGRAVLPVGRSVLLGLAVLRGLSVLLLRRLAVALRRSHGRTEGVQSFRRSELERSRCLSVAPLRLRCVTALLRLSLLRRRAPVLLRGRRLMSRLRVGRRARRRVVLRLRRGWLSPRGRWLLLPEASATLLRLLACGGGGRLLDGRSARKTKLVGGLVLSSTASADDH